MEKFYETDFTKLPVQTILGRVKTVRRLFMVVAAVALCLAAPQSAWAIEELPASKILIVELQTGSATTGTEEFVELYNPSELPLDLTGWLLQYRAATSTGSWTTKRKVACEPTAPTCAVLASGERLVLASYDIVALTNEQPMTGGFADAGGHVRLVNPGLIAAADDDVVQDILGYGTAVEAEGGLAAPKPPAGKSLKRKLSEDGYFIDTNVNGADFIVGCNDPTPGNADEPLVVEPATCQPVEDPEPPVEDPPAQDPAPEDPPAVEEPPAQPNPDPEPIIYLPIRITELLPDPASPDQDETDEFIEIFNPGNQAFSLKDYQLQSGTNYRYKYVLPDITIQPGQYMAVTSEDSGLTLSNSGTTVRVLDPEGVVLDELVNYGKAVTGQSWSKDSNGDWLWSTTATPGLANSLTLPPPKIVKAVATPKKATAKKETPLKPKVASASKAPVTSQAEDEMTEDPAAPPPNYWLLAGVGSMAVGYGLYEYRQSIAQGLRKMRLASRGKDKPE